MHGGAKGSGAPKGEHNGMWKHGGYTKEAIALRQAANRLVRAAQWDQRSYGLSEKLTMADREEVGIGIALVLASGRAPNPLPVSFKGQSPLEAGLIIMAILDECSGADIRIHRVELDPTLFAEVRLWPDLQRIVVVNSGLSGEAHFFLKD